MISLLFWSRMALSLGWSLTLGCRPDAVLRLLWYRCGLFLYSWSSFLRRESSSLWSALFIIVAMALLHRAGITSSLGGFGSCSTSLACVWVRLVCWGLVVVGVLVLGLGSMLLAVFLSCVMRFSCLVSDFMMGRCWLVFVSLVGG